VASSLFRAFSGENLPLLLAFSCLSSGNEPSYLLRLLFFTCSPLFLSGRFLSSNRSPTLRRESPPHRLWDSPSLALLGLNFLPPPFLLVRARAGIILVWVLPGCFCRSCLVSPLVRKRVRTLSRSPWEGLPDTNILFHKHPLFSVLKVGPYPLSRPPLVGSPRDRRLGDSIFFSAFICNVFPTPNDKYDSGRPVSSLCSAGYVQARGSRADLLSLVVSSFPVFFLFFEKEIGQPIHGSLPT